MSHHLSGLAAFSCLYIVLCIGSNLGLIFGRDRPLESYPDVLQTKRFANKKLLQMYISLCVKIYFYPFLIAILLKYSKNEVYLPEIQVPVLVKIKDCCAKKFLRQSFQLRKNQNNQRYLDKSFTYHTELM